MDDPFEDFKDILGRDLSAATEKRLAPKVGPTKRLVDGKTSGHEGNSVETTHLHPHRRRRRRPRPRPQTALANKRDTPRELTSSLSRKQHAAIGSRTSIVPRSNIAGSNSTGKLRGSEIIARGNRAAALGRTGIDKVAADASLLPAVVLGANNMQRAEGSSEGRAKEAPDTSRANNHPIGGGAKAGLNNNLRQQQQQLETLSEVSEELSVDWQEEEGEGGGARVRGGASGDSSEQEDRSVIYESTLDEDKDYLAEEEEEDEEGDQSILSQRRKRSLGESASSESSLQEAGRNSLSRNGLVGDDDGDGDDIEGDQEDGSRENLNFASDLESIPSGSSSNGAQHDNMPANNNNKYAKSTVVVGPVKTDSFRAEATLAAAIDRTIGRKLDLFGDNLIRLLEQRLESWMTMRLNPSSFSAAASASDTNLVNDANSQELNGHKAIVNKIVEESNELKRIIYDSILEISQRNEQRQRPANNDDDDDEPQAESSSLLPSNEILLSRQQAKDDDDDGHHHLDSKANEQLEGKDKQRRPPQVDGHDECQIAAAKIVESPEQLARKITDEIGGDGYENLLHYYERRLAKFNEIVLINSTWAAADASWARSDRFTCRGGPLDAVFAYDGGDDDDHVDGSPSDCCGHNRKLAATAAACERRLGFPLMASVSFRSGEFKFRANSLLSSVRLASKLLDRRLNSQLPLAGIVFAN